MSSSRTFPSTSGSPASGSPLPDEYLLSIHQAVERIFSRNAGNLMHQQMDVLLMRQKSSPSGVTWHPPEIQMFAIRYGSFVGAAATELVRELAQAVGSRGRLTRRHCEWILAEVRRFIARKTSPAVAETLFCETASGVTIANQCEAVETLRESLAGPARNGILERDVAREMEHAIAVYSGAKRARPPEPKPGEKVADPKTYPLMTVNEVRELFRVTRSTVYRWLDEGKLERVSLGKKAGKQARVLIRTESVARMLEQSSE